MNKSRGGRKLEGNDLQNQAPFNKALEEGLSVEFTQRFAALGLSLEVWQQILRSLTMQPLTSKTSGASDSSLSGGQSPTLWVGFSGGLDSCVLLSLLNEFLQSYNAVFSASSIRLAAIHVNHQLQTQSAAWAQWCQAWCDARNIPIIVETVSLDVSHRAQSGVESAAREARYAAFRNHVAQHDFLALAHHADDQLETVLMRWLRGTGIDGLSGMSERSELGALQLWRPLLGVPRQALQDFARKVYLDWQEDPSNVDVVFDRNFLRHQVIPQLKSRWPGVLKTVARTGEQAQAASEDITVLADRLIGNAQGNDAAEDAGKAVLPISVLEGFAERVQITILRRWLMRAGCTDFGAKHLRTIMRSVIFARADAQPEFVALGWCVRRYKQCVYVSPVDRGKKIANSGKDAGKTDAPLMSALSAVVWQPEIDASLPWAGGELMCAAPEEIRSILAALGFDSSALKVIRRDVAEVGQLPKRLKQRFQEKGIPVWQRGVWPIVTVSNEVISVPNLWSAKTLERVLSQYPGLSGKTLFQWLMK